MTRYFMFQMLTGSTGESIPCSYSRRGALLVGGSAEENGVWAVDAKSWFCGFLEPDSIFLQAGT